MLLNPSDYSYEYFKQNRKNGGEGDSGTLYLGTPKKPGLCKVLVKSNSEADAINEFLGCNIGQKIGVNTPKAWMFRPEQYKPAKQINFRQAVGIEYLDGFDDTVRGSYETEELAVQTIQGKLLHIMLDEQEGNSLGRYQDKIYAYDFAESLFFQWSGRKLHPFMLHSQHYKGVNGYINQIMDKEDNIRQKIHRYAKTLDDNKMASSVFEKTYAKQKQRFVEQYNNTHFDDLLTEIYQVYDETALDYATHLLTSVYYALLSPFNSEHLLPGTETNDEGVIVHMALSEEDYDRMIEGHRKRIMNQFGVDGA